MLRHQLAERAQAVGRRVRVLEDGRDPLPDRDVVAQRSGDEFVISVAVAGVGGEQDLLLEPEVGSPVTFPVRGQRLARPAGGLVGRASQFQRCEQRVVVVVRQPDERGVALHLGGSAAVVMASRYGLATAAT